MFPPPFEVDPDWYERYWYGERPRPKGRVPHRSWARVAVLVALFAGGSLLLSQFHL